MRDMLRRPCQHHKRVTSVDAAVQFIRQRPDLNLHSVTRASELTEGRLNYVYKITCGADSEDSAPRCVLLKYCPPYVKSLGEHAFPLTQERLRVEAEAMQLVHELSPQHTPKVLLYDASEHVLVQEYVSSHVELSTALHRHGLCFPKMAEQLADFLSQSLYFNSKYALQPDAMARLVEQFANHDIVAANERVVLLDPFDAACTSNRFPEEICTLVNELRSDDGVLAAHARLLSAYRTNKEALLHHDLHPGNILMGVEHCGSWPRSHSPPADDQALASHAMEPGNDLYTGLLDGAISRPDVEMKPKDSLYVIDYEFSTVGPMAYDVGSLLGNLLLTFLTMGHDHGCTEVQRQEHETSAANAPAEIPSTSSVAVHGRIDALGLTARGQARTLQKEASGNGMSAQQAWLLGSIETLCSRFTSNMLQLLSSRPEEDAGAAMQSGMGQCCMLSLPEDASNSLHPKVTAEGEATAAASQFTPHQALLEGLWRDTLGFAALSIIRLTIGMHHYTALDALPTAEMRVTCSSRALKLATSMLKASRSEAEGTMSVQGLVMMAQLIRFS